MKAKLAKNKFILPPSTLAWVCKSTLNYNTGHLTPLNSQNRCKTPPSHETTMVLANVARTCQKFADVAHWSAVYLQNQFFFLKKKVAPQANLYHLLFYLPPLLTPPPPLPFSSILSEANCALAPPSSVQNCKENFSVGLHNNGVASTTSMKTRSPHHLLLLSFSHSLSHTLSPPELTSHNSQLPTTGDRRY